MIYQDNLLNMQDLQRNRANFLAAQGVAPFDICDDVIVTALQSAIESIEAAIPVGVLNSNTGE